MNINNSTVIENIDTITNLMEQRYGALSELNDEAVDELIEYVILFHKDLEIGERISGTQFQRSIEGTPWHYLQFVIFVFSLFHLKMACADAIWQILIQPTAAQEDDTSVIAHVGVLHTKETEKIISNSGFQKMHQVIMHDGACRQLDCWKTEIKKQCHGFRVTNLEEFAAMEPILDDLKALANCLVRDYVERQSSILKS